MDNIKLYEINPNYITYLSAYEANAQTIYKLKLKDDHSALCKRCNEFLLLEKACAGYMK